MYTVKKIETPDRGELFAVVTGENVENVISRYNTEEEAKENCTQLNGGEVAEKKLAAAEKKAEEDAKKVAEADQKSRADRSKSQGRRTQSPRRQPQAARPCGQGQGARQAHDAEADPPAQVTCTPIASRPPTSGKLSSRNSPSAPNGTRNSWPRPSLRS